METTIHYLTWEDMEKIINQLAKEIKKDYQPDIIVTIARGGMIPSVMLSHLLRIREVETIKVKETISDEINAQKREPQIEENKNLKNIEGKRIIIVDDILGRGATIQKVQNYIKKWNPKEVRTVVGLVNEANWEKSHQEDYHHLVDYVGKTVRGWVVFPWEE